MQLHLRYIDTRSPSSAVDLMNLHLKCLISVGLKYSNNIL